MGCILDASPRLLGMALYLIGSAVVCHGLIVEGLAHCLLELPFDFVEGSCCFAIIPGRAPCLCGRSKSGRAACRVAGLMTENARLERSPSGKKIEDQDDDGENEQDVDPAAEGVSTDKAKKPKNDENDRDSPKHLWFSRESPGLDFCLAL